MSLEKHYPVQFEVLCYVLHFDGSFCVHDSRDSVMEHIGSLLEEEDIGQEFRVEQKVYTNLELQEMKEFQGW